MKICLIDCSSPFLIDEKVFPPLGLLAVGTALRGLGHDVAISGSPDDSLYFGIGATTPQYSFARTTLEQIKSSRNGSRVIIGGPHAIHNADECLKDGFDVVALGDGENITTDVFDSSGIVQLGTGSLDRYPLVDRSLINIKSYRFEINGKNATTMMTTRGCPYRCGFCAKVEPQVRYRSVESVTAEIVELKERWDYRALMLFDDTFIIRKQRAILICDAMKEHEMTWRCFVRGDLVVKHGRDFVERMADSGCAEVGIGIESGCNRILKSIRKDETTETIQEAVAMLKGAGMRVKGFFIVGLPGEDQESINETRTFLTRTPLDDVDFTVYQPYRGSPIWEDCDAYDISWETMSDGQRFYKGKPGEYNCAVHTSSMTADEITVARDNLEREFKCQPSQ